MKPAGLKTTGPKNSTDHRCVISFQVVEANLDQVFRALIAFGLHRKKEETLALILEENVRKDPAKPWISNRQIYVGSGTVLTSDALGVSFGRGGSVLKDLIHRVSSAGPRKS